MPFTRLASLFILLQELVWSDDIKSLHGALYIMVGWTTSTHTWVYFLRTTDHIFAYFKKRKFVVKKKFVHKITTLHAYKEGHILTEEFDSLFANRNI